MLTWELFPIRNSSGASSAISKVLLFVYRERSLPKEQRGVKNIMQSILTALNLSSLLSYPEVSLPLLMAFPWQLPMLLWLCWQPSWCSLAPLLPLMWNQTEIHCNQMQSMPLLHQAPCKISLAIAVLFQSCTVLWVWAALLWLQLPVYTYKINGLFTLTIYVTEQL